MRFCLGIFRVSLEHEGENATGTLEITLPDLVSWETRQCRMQHTRHIVAPFQPLRESKRAFLMMLQTNTHGPQTTQDHVGIIRRTADTHEDAGLFQLRPPLGIGGHRAHHDVGMARRVFRRRMD
ncbi:hypothetical protein D3C73_797810 [compost metagenome]